MFTSRTDVRHDIKIFNCTVNAPKTAGNFRFDFDITDIPLCLIIVNWKFDSAAHQLCCAHLLRELNGVTENHPEQTWAKKIKALLLKMKKAKERAIEKGKTKLCYSSVHRYKNQHDELISLAYSENPLPEQKKGKRGKKKRGKVLSLIDRFAKYKGQVCLFLENFSVPFDNNQAEE